MLKKLADFFKEPPVLVIPIECVISLKGDVILVNIEQVQLDFLVDTFDNQ